MKYVIRTLMVLICLMVLVGGVRAGSGNGSLKLGYTFLDEDGHQGIYHGTYNRYDGAVLSLERFRYRFDNGMCLNADLRRIAMNNRNLALGFDHPGNFGIRLTNQQYRRVYNYTGNAYTRRNQTGGSAWFFPVKYVKLYAGGTHVGRTGMTADLFGPDLLTASQEVDYGQSEFNTGLRATWQGRMFRAEYRAATYSDNINRDRDQKRYRLRLDGHLPVPRYEDWLILRGGYMHFETKYDQTEFKISANTVWGGANATLPEHFSVKYRFYFNRTSSDSDFVATDNIANAFYVTHTWPLRAGLTAGYQHDLTDDFDNEVKSNSFYFSGWLNPSDQINVRGEYGMRTEEINAGSRLVGDEDRNRFKLSARYRHRYYGTAKVTFESKTRENDQIGTETDFNRITIDFGTGYRGYGTLTGGYAYATGEYTNTESAFEFCEHFIYADISGEEYRNITAGGGITYYRSKRDLDVDRVSLRLRASYRFAEDYHIEGVYNLHNFDDYLTRDAYYTANIVEINIRKDISI